ncbi:DUF4917 family protein [Promicromonospora umidemergens]|uniref:DUF4917 family protein n=1 Tax=Promicromonospora umidemergens TaxID=629679 RepID=A0ABP8WR84_9MICO
MAATLSTLGSVTAIDAELESWSDLSSDGSWPTLLLGNGASMNIWPAFGYDSLFEKATLSVSARHIFGPVGTNFETALEYIQHARVVLQALRKPVDAVGALYDEIRDSLFNVVNDAHMEWGLLSDECATVVADALKFHSAVFTTNYDLLIYWSLMSGDRQHLQGTTDLFSGQDELRFNPGLFARTTFYYLHGAIHLWQDDDGVNGKWASREGRSLRQIASQYRPDSQIRPLFVSEGTSEEKLRTIRRSPYLSHCLNALTADAGDIVVFGHSLSIQDKHIRDALRVGHTAGRRIAFSVRPGGEAAVQRRKAELYDQFRGLQPRFFDATTHPLGNPALAVDAPTADF